MIVNSTFCIQSDTRPTFDDVTDRVAEIARESGIVKGHVIVYSQHTTCSVLIQEQSVEPQYRCPSEVCPSREIRDCPY